MGQQGGAWLLELALGERECQLRGGGFLGDVPEIKGPGRKPHSSLVVGGRGGQKREDRTQGTDIDQVPRVSPRAWLQASCGVGQAGF